VPDASCLRAWYFLWLIFSFYYSWFFLSDSAFLFVCWQRNFTVFGTNVAYSPWTYVGSGMHCLRCFLFVSWCSLGNLTAAPAFHLHTCIKLHTCISVTHLHFCYTPAFLLHTCISVTPAFLLHTCISVTHDVPCIVASCRHTLLLFLLHMWPSLAMWPCCHHTYVGLAKTFINTPYTTVNFGDFPAKMLYIHRTHMVMANPTQPYMCVA